MSELLRKLLIEEEDRVSYAYPDSKGFTTIGVGHLIDGRKGGGLPEPIIDALLDYDIAEKSALAARIPGWERLNEVRQAVVTAMVFQMGIDGVSGFRKFLQALAAGNYARAAEEMLDSKWHREDSPARARRAARMMLSGAWEPKQ